MPKNLEFGIQTNGIKHTHADTIPDIDTRFSMVKETRLFDYVDKTPAANEVEQFLLASKKYHLPIRCGGWFYMLGRDEALLIANLKIANTLGSKIHNIQLFSHNTSGKLISKQDVADFYEFALKQVECRPLFRSTCQYVVGGFLASFGSWTNSRIHGITFSDNARP